MEENITKLTFMLLRLVLCDEQLLDFEKETFSDKLLQELYALARKHDMAHIAAQGLSDLGLLGTDEISAKFQKQQMLAVYRYQRLNYELERICQTLEDAKIPFIPLKGSVIRQYYPEPWMRTSCDIDVLVHEEDLERAIECLVTQHQYVNEGRNYHDVSLFSPNGVHVELHFDLIEDEYANGANKLLSKVWDYASPKVGCQYFFEMTDEMFYFYHMAHMAKHVEYGGCGIRPFLDLWILDHRVQHDPAQRDLLLEEGKLFTFAKACRKLSEVWFSNVLSDDVSIQMQKYILHGGIYGNLDNRVAVQQKRRGGKVRYIMSRIFLSYDSLKVLYPTLQKHRWLTPIMQVRRWFRLLLKGRMKQSLHELNVNQTMAQEKIAETAELLTKLGLQ